MQVIFLFRAASARFPVKVGCFLLLLCVLTCANSWSSTSAQTKPQESAEAPVIVRGSSMVWGEGPEYSYVRSEVLVASGISLLDYEYVYRSGKRLKAELNNCAKNAFRVVDDSDVLDVKGRKSGRRILSIFRDIHNHEGAVLCRSDNKKGRLRRISGPEAEVLAYELRQYPK